MRGNFIAAWVTQQQRAFRQSTRGIPTPEDRQILEGEAEKAMVEVERAAAAKALTDAATEEERVSQQYERTSEGMRGREEWADSNRYANYAAGHAASAHALRKRAAALGLTAGQEGETE